MRQERRIDLKPRKPEEIFGMNQQEVLYGRINNERLSEILTDNQTIIHTIQESSNNYGEFQFVTTSRPGGQGRVAMTFFGLGYHEHRERWLTNEWFWYQANVYPEIMRNQIDKEDAKEMIQQRLESILPYSQEDTQSEHGKLFEILADLTDDDGALVEVEDLESLDRWLFEVEQQVPLEEPSEEAPPTGENLLDQASREKLPPLYSGEEKGLDAIAQVKFFTPDAQWTWYATEFDGEDIFFGLVSGFELELGYFSLKEVKEVKGPLGLPIARDLFYEPKLLSELMEMHKLERRGKGRT